MWQSCPASVVPVVPSGPPPPYVSQLPPPDNCFLLLSHVLSWHQQLHFMSVLPFPSLMFAVIQHFKVLLCVPFSSLRIEPHVCGSVGEGAEDQKLWGHSLDSRLTPSAKVSIIWLKPSSFPNLYRMCCLKYVSHVWSSESVSCLLGLWEAS